MNSGPEPLRVPLSVLRDATQLLLDHLQDVAGGDEVQLEHDYFWSISPRQMHDFDTVPTEMTVGQLSDCLSNLQSIVDDPDDALSYGLVWLGDILREIGHQYVR